MEEQWTPKENDLLWAEEYIGKLMKFTKRTGLNMENPHDEAYVYNVAMILHYFAENPNPIIAIGSISKEKLSDVVIDVIDWLWWRTEDFDDKITDVEKFSAWVKDVIADNVSRWEKHDSATTNITEEVAQLILKMH